MGFYRYTNLIHAASGDSCRMEDSTGVEMLLNSKCTCAFQTGEMAFEAFDEGRRYL